MADTVRGVEWAAVRPEVVREEDRAEGEVHVKVAGSETKATSHYR